MVPLPKQSDASFYRKSKTAAAKMEAAITFERLEIKTRFQLLTHIFDHARHAFVTADISRHRPTWPDVGRRRKLKMAATQTGSENDFRTEINGDAIPTALPHFLPYPTYI